MMPRKPLAAALSLLALSACSTVQQPSPNAPIQTADAPIGFFIIGDTGVIGDDGSLPLTSGLVRQQCATELRCDFGLMSGDNIYPKGATGDPAQDVPTFDALFTQPFGALWPDHDPKQPLFFVSLGNHDWYNSRAGAEAQVRFHETNRPFYMDGFFYSYRFDVQGKSVEIFVIDTEMLLSPYTLPDYDKGKDGEMVLSGETDRGGTPNALPVTEEERQQVQWFADALAASTADWKLVMGHHPIWQSRADSKFAQSQKLRELIMPALCRDADGYFAGHQHTIEVHQDSCATVEGAGAVPLPQVVSGAGAKARNIDPAFQAWQQRLYPQMTPLFAQGDTAGFVYAELRGDQIVVRPITADESGAVQTHPSFTFQHRKPR